MTDKDVLAAVAMIRALPLKCFPAAERSLGFGTGCCQTDSRA